MGGDVFVEFKKRHGLDYTEMMGVFEMAKVSYKTNENNRVTTRFPGSLADILIELTECNIKTMLENV